MRATTAPDLVCHKKGDVFITLVSKTRRQTNLGLCSTAISQCPTCCAQTGCSCSMELTLICRAESVTTAVQFVTDLAPVRHP